MKIGAAFPSTYLKATDLQGQEVPVVMDRVAIEDVGSGENKPVLYFQHMEKGLVLNKTNAGRISHFYGDETDHWPGKEIVLYPDVTEFQGRTTDCIRVRAPNKSGQATGGHPSVAGGNGGITFGTRGQFHNEQTANVRHDERNPPPHPGVKF